MAVQGQRFFNAALPHHGGRSTVGKREVVIGIFYENLPSHFACVMFYVDDIRVPTPPDRLAKADGLLMAGPHSDQRDES